MADTTMTQIKARDLRPGDMFDVPEDVAAGTDNDVCAEYEYAVLESVNGGWADGVARAGEVVLYVPNFAAPVLIDGERLVTLVKTA